MARKRILLKGHVEKSDLGLIAEQFETGGRGPGTYSSGMMGHGKKDPGGVSYGLYQLTSQTPEVIKDKHGHKHLVIHQDGGNVARFLEHEGKEWADEFKGLKPGSADFSKRWEEVARREPDGFAAAQQGFIGRTHFQPQMEHIQRETGLDMSTRSTTLQNVVWSTAVQHGPHTEVISKSLADRAKHLHKDVHDLTDKECIDAIYQERERVFPACRERYERERKYARDMLDFEEKNPQASLRDHVGSGVSHRDSPAGGSLAVPHKLSETLSDSQRIASAAMGQGLDPASVAGNVVESLAGQSDVAGDDLDETDSGVEDEQDRHSTRKKPGKKKGDKSPSRDLNPHYGRGPQ